MAQQRLYTEEQVKKAIAIGYDWCHVKYMPSDDMIDSFIESLNPIQLPSDEEAGVIALKISETLKDKHTAEEEAFYLAGFQTCAKWLRDKIQGGNK